MLSVETPSKRIYLISLNCWFSITILNWTFVWNGTNVKQWVLVTFRMIEFRKFHCVHQFFFFNKHGPEWINSDNKFDYLYWRFLFYSLKSFLDGSWTQRFYCVDTRAVNLLTGPQLLFNRRLLLAYSNRIDARYLTRVWYYLHMAAVRSLELVRDACYCVLCFVYYILFFCYFCVHAMKNSNCSKSETHYIV